MAKNKLRGTYFFPGGGGTQQNIENAISQSTQYLHDTIQQSVAGLTLETNKTVSTTQNGTLVVEPSDGKDGMEKATVTVAVPLESNKASSIDVAAYTQAVEITPSDGNTAMKKATVTLTNIPVHEANKTATVDVSQYTEPVEIEPSANKDVMDKVTVTLSNIPAIEANKTAEIDVSQYSEAVEVTPSSGKDGMAKATVSLSNIPVVEDEKEVTIDASLYAEPVEITPTDGSDVMAKTTVTLSNIGFYKLYAWTTDGGTDPLCWTVNEDGTGAALVVSEGVIALGEKTELMTDRLSASDIDLTE